MFTRIGLAVSRHPVVVLAVWALLLTVMTGLAFQGLGAGGLFERLASAEATTPDTDSHVVYSMTRTDGEGGESITVVVSGVDVAGDPASAAAAASAAVIDSLKESGAMTILISVARQGLDRGRSHR